MHGESGEGSGKPSDWPPSIDWRLIKPKTAIQIDVEGGRTIAETRVLALELKEMGFDALHISIAVSVLCEGEDGPISLPAETDVSAFGYKPNNKLEEIAKAVCKEVYIIGGAVKTTNALVAIQTGLKL